MQIFLFVSPLQQIWEHIFSTFEGRILPNSYQCIALMSQEICATEEPTNIYIYFTTPHCITLHHFTSHHVIILHYSTVQNTSHLHLTVHHYSTSPHYATTLHHVTFHSEHLNLTNQNCLGIEFWGNCKFSTIFFTLELTPIFWYGKEKFCVINTVEMIQKIIFC